MFTVARCNACEREHISFAFPDAVARVCSECRLNMTTTTEDVFVLSHADLLSHGAQVVQAVVEQFPVGMLTSEDLVNASYIAGGATDSEWPLDWNDFEFGGDGSNASTMLNDSDNCVEWHVARALSYMKM